MNRPTTSDDFGALLDAQTLRIQRRLPGPIERVWAYLTQSGLRRQWLAAGEMELNPGSGFELVWRNDELTDSPDPRPEGFAEEHRMHSHIVAVEPPHRLVFTWGEKETGEVEFQLQPEGDDVLLTVTHRRIAERAILLRVGAGWHTHLDILVARLDDLPPEPFWSTWRQLHAAYDARVPN